MTRSIRWTLLLGYTLILSGVMGAFGGMLYFQVRSSAMLSVERELRSEAGGLLASIEEKSNGRFEITLSDAQAKSFQMGSEYIIWDRNGDVVDYTWRGLLRLRPELGARPRETSYDYGIEGPAGSRILVTHSIRGQLGQLRELLGLIVGIGFAVFAVGFVGGWILVGRLLRPIRRITHSAAAISDRNLSTRIDVSATERELAELARTLNGTFDKLEAAFLRQRRFTADASHELRTPLSVLTTQLEVALRKPRSSEEYRETIEVCLKAVLRMTVLAEGLLLLSKSDSGSLRLDRTELDLKEVVDEAVTFVRPLADERKISLAVDADSFFVSGDRARLAEAVLNVVTNAIHYNRPGGSVTVMLKDGKLTIADTGAGIPEGDSERVFERFYRADEARSRNSGGAGLGLAITKSIIDAHGGRITFRSAYGKGAEFRIELPAIPAPAAARPA